MNHLLEKVNRGFIKEIEEKEGLNLFAAGL